MEALLKNLKKYIECSICLESFTEPKTIACLHTFCCECLKKHALTSQKDGQFRCPECQTQIAIPEGNRFDQLPTSFLHNSLLSLLAFQQSGDGRQISCKVCTKKSAELSYCFGCEMLLCQGCLQAHEMFQTTAFSGHKVTSVKQFQVEDYEALLKRKAFCAQKYHEKEVTRFYCRVCQTCICQICLSMEHKTHEIELLDKVADEERAKILAGVESIKQKHLICSDIIRQLEETAANLEANIATAKRQVCQSAKQMIAVIRERERETITTLENTRVSRKEKLDEVKKQVQQLEKQFKQAAEFATELAQRSSSADIMRSKGYLEERLEELGKTQFPKISASSFVKFVSTCKLDNLSLGKIRSGSETNPIRSTIEGLKQTFQAGVEAEISICSQTREGQFSNRQPEDHVEVQVDPAEQLASLIVNEQAGGKFQVKFVPKLPGSYNISTKINGDNLDQSPFTIRIQERKLEIVGELDLKNESMKIPAGVAVSGKGLIAVADYSKHCFLVFDSRGKFHRLVGCYGDNPGELNSPIDVTFMNDDEILIADECNHRIQQFNVHSGNFVNSFGRYGTGDGEFRHPVSVSMDGKGHVIVAEYNNHRVQVLTKDGIPVLKFGDRGPEKLCFPVGCVYYKNTYIVADSANGCLKVFDCSGKFLRKIGNKGEGAGHFLRPWRLCVDKYENLVVSDKDSGHVKQFNVKGCFSGSSFKLKGPSGVATMSDGRFLTAESLTGRIIFLK